MKIDREKPIDHISTAFSLSFKEKNKFPMTQNLIDHIYGIIFAKLCEKALCYWSFLYQDWRMKVLEKGLEGFENIDSR